MKKSLPYILTLLAVSLFFGMILIPTAHRPKERSDASRTLGELRMIDAAIDQYSIEFRKQPGSPVSWSDIQLYLHKGPPLYSSQGKDMFGNPYLFKEVGTPPKISQKTYEALSDVAPKEFWSPFY